MTGEFFNFFFGGGVVKKDSRKMSLKLVEVVFYLISPLEYTESIKQMNNNIR